MQLTTASTVIVAVLFILFSGLLKTCNATGSVFVEIETRRERCFLEDVSVSTPIRAKYALFESDSQQSQSVLRNLMQAQQEIWMHRTGAINLTHDATNPLSGVSLHAWIEDPSGNTVAEIQDNQEGEMMYTSRSIGEHKVCFEAKSDKRGGWFGARPSFYVTRLLYYFLSCRNFTWTLILVPWQQITRK